MVNSIPGVLINNLMCAPFDKTIVNNCFLVSTCVFEVQINYISDSGETWHAKVPKTLSSISIVKVQNSRQIL